MTRPSAPQIAPQPQFDEGGRRASFDLTMFMDGSAPTTPVGEAMFNQRADHSHFVRHAGHAAAGLVGTGHRIGSEYTMGSLHLPTVTQQFRNALTPEQVEAYGQSGRYLRTGMNALAGALGRDRAGRLLIDGDPSWDPTVAVSRVAGGERLTPHAVFLKVRELLAGDIGKGRAHVLLHQADLDRIEQGLPGDRETALTTLAEAVGRGAADDLIRRGDLDTIRAELTRSLARSLGRARRANRLTNAVDTGRIRRVLSGNTENLDAALADGSLARVEHLVGDGLGAAVQARKMLISDPQKTRQLLATALGRSEAERLMADGVEDAAQIREIVVDVLGADVADEKLALWPASIQRAVASAIGRKEAKRLVDRGLLAKVGTALWADSEALPVSVVRGRQTRARTTQ